MKNCLLLVGFCFAMVAQATDGVDLLPIQGENAQLLFESMEAESEFDGAYRLTKKETGNLKCVLRLPWRAAASFTCTLGESLALEGDLAKQVYGAFLVNGDFDGAYHTTKEASGTLACTERSPWRGPSVHFCEFISE